MKKTLVDNNEPSLCNILEGYDEFKRKRALKNCFKKSSWNIELTDFNRFIRCWCWLKTVICLLARRTKGSYLNTGGVCVLSYDWVQNYESQDWSAVWLTSPKLFKGWSVYIGSDGT